MSRTPQCPRTHSFLAFLGVAILAVGAPGQIAAVYTSSSTLSYQPTLRTTLPSLSACGTPAPNINSNVLGFLRGSPYSPPTSRTTLGGLAIDQPNNLFYWTDGTYIVLLTNDNLTYATHAPTPLHTMSPPLFGCFFTLPTHPDTSISFGQIRGMAAIPPANISTAPYFQGDSSTAFGLIVTDGHYIDLVTWQLSDTAGHICNGQQGCIPGWTGYWDSQTGPATMHWANVWIAPVSSSITLTGLEWDPRGPYIWACDSTGVVHQIDATNGTVIGTCGPPPSSLNPGTIIGNITDRSVAIGSGCGGQYVTDGIYIYDLANSTSFLINDPSSGGGVLPGFGAAFYAQGNTIGGSGFNGTDLWISEYAPGVPNNPTQAIGGIWSGYACPGDNLTLAVDGACTSGGIALPFIAGPNVTPTYWLTTNAVLYSYGTIASPLTAPPNFAFGSIPASFIGTTFYAQWLIIPSQCNAPTGCSCFIPCVPGAVFASDALVMRVSDY
jgi:hypothetical protein